jgi:hypothetical protein
MRSSRSTSRGQQRSDWSDGASAPLSHKLADYFFYMLNELL